MSGLELEPAEGAAGHVPPASPPCDPVLPIGDLVDVFDFARFAPLRAARDGKATSVVVPNDYVVPDTVAFVNGRVPVDRRAITAWRGGVPLVEEWEPVNPRANPAALAKVTVGSVADFIARPRVTVGGHERDVALTPGGVRELLATGTASFVLDGGDTVNVQAKPDVSTLGLPHSPRRRPRSSPR